MPEAIHADEFHRDQTPQQVEAQAHDEKDACDFLDPLPDLGNVGDVHVQSQPFPAQNAPPQTSTAPE
jgi:hypothetical protein